MSPLVIAMVAFGCIFGSALAGMLVGSRLPEHHLASDTKDVVKVSMAMIGTMTALLLGLVTASAKTAFDAEDAAVRSASAGLLSLDRMLAAYGPQTLDLRESIVTLVTAKMVQVWPEDGGDAGDVAGASMRPGEVVLSQILALSPQSEAQQWYKGRALELVNQVLQARWVLFGGVHNTPPTVFLVVMICWLGVLFGSFGLFAPRNGTVLAALLMSSLSVAASIFLILEMSDPFGGIMKISSEPIRYAVAHIGQ